MDASRWFVNGDHPDDHPDGCPAYGEGRVVRYFRDPDRPGDAVCRHCGRTMHSHGWIDTLEGGHIVCPGDWIVTGVVGERYPVKDEVFQRTYQPITAEGEKTRVAAESDTPGRYDSRADTLLHSLRVGALMGQAIAELVDRSVRHDVSKTEPPEVAVFDEFTPRLKDSTYGSQEYQGFLAAMGEALQHHYAKNRHHPEHFGELGINGMTLLDLVEMLADWKAATERHTDGDLAQSLKIQKERFGISDQLVAILHNTAAHLGWMPR